MKQKTYNQEYLAKLSFRFDREIKSFIDKQNIKECSTTKPSWASQVALVVRIDLPMQETQVMWAQFLGLEDPLE